MPKRAHKPKIADKAAVNNSANDDGEATPEKKAKHSQRAQRHIKLDETKPPLASVADSEQQKQTQPGHKQEELNSKKKKKVLPTSTLAEAEESSSDEEFEGGWRRACIKCKRIGNVLLCEGCPNVMHAKCARLTAAQAEALDEWFCGKCQPTSAAAKAKQELSKLEPKLKEPPKPVLYFDNYACLICEKFGDVILCKTCTNGTHLACSGVLDPHSWSCMGCDPSCRWRKLSKATTPAAHMASERKTRAKAANPSKSIRSKRNKPSEPSAPKTAADIESHPNATSKPNESDKPDKHGLDALDPVKAVTVPVKAVEPPKADLNLENAQVDGNLHVHGEPKPDHQLSQDMLSMLEVCGMDPHAFFKGQLTQRSSDIKVLLAEGAQVPFTAKLLCALLICDIKPAALSARSFTNKLAADFVEGAIKSKYREQVRKLEGKLKSVRAIEEFQMTKPLQEMSELFHNDADDESDVAHATQSLAYLQSVLATFQQTGIPAESMAAARKASLDDTCWTVLEAVSDVMGSLEYLSPSLTKLLLDSSKLLAKLHGIVQLPKLLNNGQIRGIYKQAFQDTLEFMLQASSTAKRDVALAMICDVFSAPSLHSYALEHLLNAIDAQLASLPHSLQDPTLKRLPQENLVYCLEALRSTVIASHRHGSFVSLRDSKLGRALAKTLEQGVADLADKLPLTSMILFDCLAQMRMTVAAK